MASSIDSKIPIKEENSGNSELYILETGNANITLHGNGAGIDFAGGTEALKPGRKKEKSQYKGGNIE